MLLTKLPKSSVNRSKRFKRLLPLLLFMLFLFLTHELFIITKTECQLDKEDCPPEIIQKLDKLIGSNVLFLNQKRLTKELVHSFLVEKVGVGFKVFNTLRVNLASGSPAIPTMVILVKDLPVISMDTAAGSTESANWPKPSGELEIYTQGDKLSPELLNALLRYMYDGCTLGGLEINL